MKVLYVASEALPFAATGGLGDVIGSLPKAVLQAAGGRADIRVVIPLYRSIKEKYVSVLKEEAVTTVRLAWRNQYMGIFSMAADGVTYYFIDNDYYFKRAFLYGSFDDGERFAYFGKAVLALMTTVGFFPDVLHAHDWQAAAAVIYLKRKLGLDPAFEKIKTLFTIHNIEYQGIFDFSTLADVFELAHWDRPVVEYNGAINLMKGAVACADWVNTVSPRYASEIMTEYYSHGLCHILRMHAGKISGILNGIDTAYYNSETDPDIAAHFSAGERAGKGKNKAELQKLCFFEADSDIPVIAMVSRLASHKGFDLVMRVAEEFLARNSVQMVLLGSGDYDFEAYFARLAQKYPKKFCARLEYNKPLSKLFYAGADLFLMPSKSEPCGLSQMIASRYGTVPIVRETGGLADTIRPYNQYTGEGNGFSFTNYNAHEMMAVIEHALWVYSDRNRWTQLVKNVMEKDFSWNRSAKKYLQLYEAMCKKE